MYTHDLILAANSFRSVVQARHMIETLPFLVCDHLLILVMPDRAEAMEIADYAGHEHAKVIILFSRSDSYNLGRAFPFVWCWNNGIRGRYYVVTDDDMEFIELSRAIYPLACVAFPRFHACMLGFESTHPYKYPDHPANEENFKVGLPWIDGNFILTQWEDNERFGVWDGPPDYPLTAFTETEYCHRFRALSGRQIILRWNDVYYRHKMVSRYTTLRARQRYHHGRTVAGNGFWRTKFGIEVDLNDRQQHDTLYDRCCLDQELFKRHIVFGGLWNDWRNIWTGYHSNFECILDGR